MIRVLRTHAGKAAGLALQFGSIEGLENPPPILAENEVFNSFKKDRSNLFPGMVGFLWADDFGFNPGLIWIVLQFGPLYGVAGTNRTRTLFGDRLLGAFA